MKTKLIDCFLDMLEQLVNSDSTDWKAKRLAILDSASESQKTALFEFVNWFEEPTS